MSQLEDRTKKLNNEALTFNDYSADLKLRNNAIINDVIGHAIVIIIFGFFLFLLFFAIFFYRDLIIKEVYYGVSLIIIFIITAPIVINALLNLCIVLLIKRFPKLLILFIPITTYLLCFNIAEIINGLFSNNKFIWNVLVVLISIFSLVISNKQIKKFPSYLTVSISETVTLLLSILAIMDSIDLTSFSNFYEGLLITLIININCVNIIIEKKAKSDSEKASKIFMKQLLIDNPSYSELLKCYKFGGNEYKEKILEVEKFLKIINKKEKLLQ